MLLGVLVLLFSHACALNILLTSTGRWDTTNLRSLYDRLKSHPSHNVLLVAPLTESKSCQGLVREGSNSDNISGCLLRDTDYINREQSDHNIWHIDDCPARTSLIALDYIIPTFYVDWSFDLIIVGPTEESNAGPLNHLFNPNFQLSKFLSFRQIPVISLHATGPATRFHSSRDQPDDSALLYSQKVIQLIDGLSDYVRDAPFGNHDFQTTKSRFVDQNNVKFDEKFNRHDQLDDQNSLPRVLPHNVILNVNFPMVGSSSQVNCVDPQFEQSSTRSEFQLMIPSASFDESSNNFDIEMAPINTPMDPKDDSGHPSELLALESCAISVTAISNTGEDVEIGLSDILDPRYRIKKDLESLDKLKKHLNDEENVQGSGPQHGDFYSGKLNALVEQLFK
ncbi:hypothetical protein PP7435_CHR2-0595 [Komagataella phaffii CBS 7435]|uniref:Survival protein SurE-like phosphatase/nucleotidase domain-containing protein n=2 Tax=Komagataella phaffii TaxID=460519 RepID=C4R1F8_KOMPG|nr:Hypothetical protein PAS_chr2-1_0685 [Komagataella phaffii GS115]AOA61894.1 GQ67_00750T0 [Komagataella phaffii]CAH2448138.1 hypothetical protein BQ9382_C2-3230 [Komagataella phaffii CBS 7435]AOA66929.1 GQ68_00639T0 [Komagataella phaffii GS115]CAY69332.1 Hypothetical protein PAS_chr2-1_0685 [Komagataella phaffii GS115]CCA38282.1 hypothetical protein PP7435_CHR2-0595 [Komagataella phaffii CBS 7435]